MSLSLSAPLRAPARRTAALALVLATLLAAACSDAFEPRGITLPGGFSIRVYAEVDGARSMALGERGTLFVGTRSNAVYAVTDDDGDMRADRVRTVAGGLNMPNGVAFRDGALYVAEINRILRYDGIEDRLDTPPSPAVVRDDLPTDRHHGWKYIAFGPDGWLYVPVGAPCNVCERLDDQRYASILRMRPDGSDLEVYASGIRNTVGFDWHPATGELWFTNNGRDWMGDDLPPDTLHRAPRPGLHFGFPYCHGGDLPDPEFGQKRSCAEFEPPAWKLPAHVAPLGMAFYKGTMFPQEYRGRIFVCEHGSWNRSSPVGYQVVSVALDNGRPVSAQPFAGGWLRAGLVTGRPVDVLELPDGSLLVSDDKGGRIYRITYHP